MIVKSIAVAGVAGLALGFTGLAGTAVAAGTPQNGTHACANLKAEAAHARNVLRKAAHKDAVAERKLAKAENAHGAHSKAVKVAKAHADKTDANLEDAQAAFDAAAQKRHNCTNPQTTGGTDGTATTDGTGDTTDTTTTGDTGDTTDTTDTTTTAN